jgi:four helix bundle protein
MDLTVASYGLCALLPATERFELSSQIRRAAVSVPANVAEGHAGETVGRCIHHLRIALGSLGDLRTAFELAVRLRFLTEADLRNALDLSDRVGQLLHGLLRAKKAQRLKSLASGSTLLALPAIGWLILLSLR